MTLTQLLAQPIQLDAPDGLTLRLYCDRRLLVFQQDKQSRAIVDALWGQISAQAEQARTHHQPLLVLAHLGNIGQSPYARQKSAMSIASYTGVTGRFAFVFPAGLSIARVLKTFMLRDLNSALPTVSFRDFPTEDEALAWLLALLPDADCHPPTTTT